MKAEFLLVSRVRIAAGHLHLLMDFQRHCAQFARPRHLSLRVPGTTRKECGHG